MGKEKRKKKGGKKSSEGLTVIGIPVNTIMHLVQAHRNNYQSFIFEVRTNVTLKKKMKNRLKRNRCQTNYEARKINGDIQRDFWYVQGLFSNATMMNKVHLLKYKLYILILMENTLLSTGISLRFELIKVKIKPSLCKK